jgi:hypothetical protein
MSLRNFTLSIRRLASGAYVDGTWQAEIVTSTFDIRASVQPLKPKEMETLPEGRRNSQAYRIYTDIELHTTRHQNPDRVELFGEEFEILSVAVWQNGIISHYKAIAVKLEQPAVLT